MRAFAASVLLVVACGGEPAAPPTAPTATASLEVPPLPPPKPSADRPVVRQAAPAPAMDEDDESPLPNDPAAAEAAFREAKIAMSAGDLAKARAFFLRSLRLDHAVGTLLNLASCEEQLGDKQRALRHYLAAADEASKKGFNDRAAFARERAAHLMSGP